jgi:hypothetical protein
MPQIRLESTVRHHPKFLRAGPAACWLYACGIGYCQDHLTDGFIPAECLDQLGPVSEAGWNSLTRLVQRLVDPDLWEAVDGGWRVHDYLDHNKTAEAVLKLKGTRRGAASKGGKRSWEVRSSSKQSASDDAKQSASEFNWPSLEQPASDDDAAPKQNASISQSPLEVHPKSNPSPKISDICNLTDSLSKTTDEPKQSASSDLNPDHDHDHDHKNLRTRPAAPPADSRCGKPVDEPKSNVSVIAALVREELIPAGLRDGDLIEATKTRCAERGIAYTSIVVRKAVDSALAQTSRSHQS